MQFAAISHALNNKEANLGDDIQAIAAAQFYPRLDMIIEREAINTYEQEIFAIVNGWYMHNPENFPPNPSIKSHITSIHIAPSAHKILLSEESIEYFRAHEPIGCRDIYTRDLLLERGIRAFFSGCLTLTLDKNKFERPVTNLGDILLVDAFYRYTPRGLKRKLRHKIYSGLTQKRLISKLVSSEMRPSIRRMSHFLGRSSATFEQRFQLAERLLCAYANARLVVTSRLHAAMPCLAFGIPVLFVVEDANDPRLSGNLDLLNVLTRNQVERTEQRGILEIGGRKIKWDELSNPDRYKELREKLIAEVSQAVQRYVNEK